MKFPPFSSLSLSLFSFTRTSPPPPPSSFLRLYSILRVFSPPQRFPFLAFRHLYQTLLPLLCFGSFPSFFILHPSLFILFYRPSSLPPLPPLFILLFLLVLLFLPLCVLPPPSLTLSPSQSEFWVSFTSPCLSAALVLPLVFLGDWYAGYVWRSRCEYQCDRNP